MSMFGTPILNLTDQWLVVTDGKMRSIEGPEYVSGPKWIVTDFDASGSGVETVAGPSSYAPALIEKRLRTEGDLDGPGRVLVHTTRQVAGTSQVLFTAVAAAVYARQCERCADESDHCLLMPLTAVLSRRARLDGDNVAIVLRHGRVLDLLVNLNGHPEAVARSTAFSESSQDIEGAVHRLAGEFGDIIRENNLQPERVHWYGLPGQEQEDAGLAQLFEALSKVEVTCPEAARSKGAGFQRFLDAAKAADAVGSAPARISYRLENAMPAMAAVMIALCLAVFGADWRWTYLSGKIEQELSQGAASSIKDSLQQKALSLITLAQEQAVVSAAHFDFITRLDEARRAPDLRKILRDIREATPQGVRILGIGLSNSNRGPRVAVAGTSEKPLPDVVRDLERFGAALRERGYIVDERSSGAMNEDNIFRLSLKLDATNA